MAHPAGIVTTPWADWTSLYVDGASSFTSFSRNFSVLDAFLGSILEVEVLTGYEDFADSAEVRVNGWKVGVIEPRPVSRYQDLQLVSVPFWSAYYLGGYPHTSSNNNLSIVPVNQAAWLVVARWRIHYDRYS